MYSTGSVHALVCSFYFAWKVIIEAFSSIFDVLHCSFYQISLKRQWRWCFRFRNLQSWDIRYHRHLWNPDVFHDFNQTWEESLTINLFLFLDIVTGKIYLFSISIATPSHLYSKPTLSKVSSTIYSSILFF